MELPREYMVRCAQCGGTAVFQYREELLGGMEHLRFIGVRFVGEEVARRWDDRPGNICEWRSFPSWESATAWLTGDEGEEAADGGAGGG